MEVAAPAGPAARGAREPRAALHAIVELIELTDKHAGLVQVVRGVAASEALVQLVHVLGEGEGRRRRR